MKAEKERHTENPLSLGTRVNTTTDMMQIKGEDTANWLDREASVARQYLPSKSHKSLPLFSQTFTLLPHEYSALFSVRSLKKKIVPKVTGKGCSNRVLTENRCCRYRWGQYRYCLVSRWHSQQWFGIHTGARLSPRVVLIVCLAPRS